MAEPEYLPTFRLSFAGGVSNEYRLHENRVEFRPAEGEWRVLAESDVQLHYVLHTEVAKWLHRALENARRTSSV
jgi:hypothetical protein